MDVSERPNNIVLKDRREAVLTGIFDVVSFTDGEISMTCRTGGLTLVGEELKIDRFDSDSGELSVVGNIGGVFYLDGARGKKGKKNRGVG